MCDFIPTEIAICLAECSREPFGVRDSHLEYFSSDWYENCKVLSRYLVAVSALMTRLDEMETGQCMKADRTPYLEDFLSIVPSLSYRQTYLCIFAEKASVKGQEGGKVNRLIPQQSTEMKKLPVALFSAFFLRNMVPHIPCIPLPSKVVPCHQLLPLGQGLVPLYCTTSNNLRVPQSPFQAPCSLHIQKR